MRRSPMLLLVFLLGTALYAAEESDRQPAAVVRAATTKAYASLYDQIAQLPLTDTLSVGAFVKLMDAQDEFGLELQRSDQLGGPRWIDRNTCQVQLEISTARVTQSLQRIAGARPGRSPVTAAQISRATDQWPQRMISATGCSTSAVALKDLRPRSGNAWSSVNDRARQQALREANAAAVRRAMDSVAPVVLADGQTIGSAFEKPEVGRSVQEWLASRPVTRVDFRDDMQVEVALSVDEREFYDEIRSVVTPVPGLTLPQTPEQWDRVWRDYLGKFHPAVGRAAISAGPLTKAVALRIPAAAPEWVNDSINIQGSASVIGSKLKTAVRAETDARAKLRERIESLELEKGLTMADAAKQDPRVADAVSRFVKSARIYKTEYRADSTVVIHLAADPRDLWEDLRR